MLAVIRLWIASEVKKKKAFTPARLPEHYSLMHSIPVIPNYQIRIGFNPREIHTSFTEFVPDIL